MTHKTAITYWEYIGLDRLLALQEGIEQDGDVKLVDEMHFIVIHQSIELMFKLLLKELRLARDVLGSSFVPDEVLPEVVKHMGRAVESLRVATGHFRLMGQLNPLDFLTFRDKLGTSSGAQSFQMRELEHLLGLPSSERREVLRRLRDALPDPSVADRFEDFILEPLGAVQDQIAAQIEAKGRAGLDDAADRWVAQHIQRAMEDIEANGTLRASLGDWLQRTPICASSPPRPDDPHHDETLDLDQRAVRAFIDDYLQRAAAAGWTPQQVDDLRLYLRGDDAHPRTWETERIRAALLFIEMYPDLPLLTWPRMLLDKLVELEEALVHFRNAHARMVERVIGSRPGTGGSPGILYLDLTRDTRVFPELIQIRGVLIPKHHRWNFPALADFGFRL